MFNSCCRRVRKPHALLRSAQSAAVADLDEKSLENCRNRSLGRARVEDALAESAHFRGPCSWDDDWNQIERLTNFDKQGQSVAPDPVGREIAFQLGHSGAVEKALQARPG